VLNLKCFDFHLSCWSARLRSLLPARPTLPCYRGIFS
jgi:hypothetical protein